jgi:hypothetical protein
VDLKNLKNTPPAPACSWGTTDNGDTDLNVEEVALRRRQK